MATHLFTIGEVARRTGASRAHLAYLFERGALPQPSYQVPGRRLFTERDVEGIIRALNDRKRSGPK